VVIVRGRLLLTVFVVEKLTTVMADALVRDVETLRINHYDKDWSVVQSSSEFTEFTVSYSYEKVPSLQKFCEIQVFSLLQRVIRVHAWTLDSLLSELVRGKELPSKLAQRFRTFIPLRRIRYFKPVVLGPADVTVRTHIYSSRPINTTDTGPIWDVFLIPIRMGVENYCVIFTEEHGDWWRSRTYRVFQVFYTNRQKSAQEVPDVARYFLDVNHQVVKMLEQGKTDV